SFRVSSHLPRTGALRVSSSSWLAGRLSWGLFPFSVCGAGSPLYPGACLPRHVPPARFLPPRRSPSPCPSRFVSPWNARGILPTEPSPPEDRSSSRSACPSCRYRHAPSMAGAPGDHPPEEVLLRGSASGGSSLPESVLGCL